MDFPIEDRKDSGLKLDEKSDKPKGESPNLPGFGSEGLSTTFEDDLMREFNQKHSTLSTFLDERVSDLTSSGVAQSDREVPSSNKNPFGDDLHEQMQSDFDYEFVRRQEQGEPRKFGGDIGFETTTGTSEKAGAESLFSLDGGSEIGHKTEPAAGGDHGKFLDEHDDQLMGQFERVSPNMINYGYDVETTMATRSGGAHFPEPTDSQEVPFSTGHQTFSPPFGQPQQQRNDLDDDDEDDFEKDSISQQSQSQALSNKLSDSLEALKDIPREIPPPVHDHFAAPTSLSQQPQRHGPHDDDEDDFEKDSISSHPLSHKLSDSLEVLKDSPQKDLKFDESLMDLEDLPSSKNSMKSISPNDVPNIDDFGDIHGTAASLSSQGQGGGSENIIGLGDISSSFGTLPASESRAFAIDNFLSENAHTSFIPTTTSSSTNNAFESLPPEINASSSLIGDFDHVINRDSSPLVDIAPVESQVTTLPEVAQSTVFDLPDISKASTEHSNNTSLPEIATSGLTSNLLLSESQPEVTDTFSQGNLPDVTSSLKESPNAFDEEVEDLPPPIPPHQNLHVFPPPDVSSSAVRDRDSPEFYPSNGIQQPLEIQDILNPFDHTTSRGHTDDYVNRYGVEDPVLEQFERREEAPPPLPQRGGGFERSREDLNTGGEALMTASIIMSSSIEEVIQPRFYESEDSSTKTDAPLLDVESKDQQSVTEEFEDLLPPEKEPAFESLSKSSLESQSLLRDFSPEPSVKPETLREKEREAELLVDDVLEQALPKAESKFTPEVPVMQPVFQKEPEPEPWFEPEPPIKVQKPEPPKVEPKPEPPKVEPEPPKKPEPETPKVEPKETKEEPKVLPKPEPKPQPKIQPKVEKPRTVDYEEPLEISEDVQQILNTFNPKNWFQPEKLHPKVSELVYWRDPKKSGIVFGASFVILLSLTFLSLISVVAYTSLAVLSGTLAFRVYKSVLQAVQKTQDGHPFKEYLDAEVTVPSEKAQEVSAAVINQLNKTALKLRSLFLVEDIVESAKFGAVLYFLTYIGAWFNGLTLVILGLIALFAAPKVYETNKTVIDQYLDLVSAKISEINAKVTAAIPFLKKEKAQ